SLATYKGDLASLTAPPFILSPRSMIEFPTYWCEHPSIFVAPAHEPDPEKRVLLVLKWFLTTLREQHSTREENGKKKKLKPLNPFLGERFLGKWEDKLGTTNLIAEQVSHHPPITACKIWNEEHGIQLRGHVAPRVYFSGTVQIDRPGYSLLQIDKYNESYLITLPKVHVGGLLTASLFLELSGSSYIRSSSGYTVKIDYSSRGWWSGKRNSFVANVFHDDQKDEPLYTAEGQWNNNFVIKMVKTQQVIEEFDLHILQRTLLDVAPIERQNSLESRRAWYHVATAIEEGDLFAVGHEKSKIENQQREMRKVEKRNGSEFPRKYFTRVETDLVAERLAKGMTEAISLEKSMEFVHGVWIWDEEKADKI
ncbi:hypothetical protein B0O99DRAFT_518974, partial [Bisporella sp. PMI_857]